MKRSRVQIKHSGKPDPNYIAPSGAPVGWLAEKAKIGRIVGNSPKYNSSFLVTFPQNLTDKNGLVTHVVYDIHDQHFEYLPCICKSLVIQHAGCQCGGI